MKRNRLTLLAATVFCAVNPFVALIRADPLSDAQQVVVEKAIFRLSKEEKTMVQSWSDAKKLAEFFCASAGLKAMQKQEKSAERILMGPDEAGTKNFILVGNTHLKGTGAVRLGPNWKNFEFTCELDALKGIVSSFTYIILP